MLLIFEEKNILKPNLNPEIDAIARNSEFSLFHIIGPDEQNRQTAFLFLRCGSINRHVFEA